MYIISASKELLQGQSPQLTPAAQTSAEQVHKEDHGLLGSRIISFSDRVLLCSPG